MSHRGETERWTGLDKDLKRVTRVEAAAMFVSRPLVGLGIGLFLIALAALAAGIVTPSGSSLVVLAAAFGAYMALNIGANDVANNMGPAVGAKALSMTGAIAIAAICESAGALLGGSHVVATISRGIVGPASFQGPEAFTLTMMGGLLGAAVWVNIATWIGAPVSTTHSIVGGVLGAGAASAGVAAVSWSTIAVIALSWVAAPILGGVVAALVLAGVYAAIIDRRDRVAAARLWVPVLIGIMAAAFSTYLAMKGLNPAVRSSPGRALIVGLPVGLLAALASRPFVERAGESASLDTLFRLPLIVSAALLSFAHGANDVANAVGPLAAIVGAEASGTVPFAVPVPLWVMVIGAAGISFGLILFGPRLIHMVGKQITKLNPIRACCVALAAAVTVIGASWLGLPVSSTHTVIGGLFGVGFYREWRADRKLGRPRVQDGLLAREERRRRKLVRRSHFMTIVAAWAITVPAAALLSALAVQVLHRLA
ncbi:inorganic phosphate transporter [Palleronia sp.]|uniref:inorganic phosphate transporter n=1 Tax=Palleronia sp. TaxID=1940284 RepID=UPI0035C7B218